MGNPFEEFKKSFHLREIADLHKAAVERVGAEKVEYGIQIMNQLWDHFQPRYGDERTGQILGKLPIPPPPGWNVDRLIHVGERWHVINLFFNKKITNEEFRSRLAAVDAAYDG